LHFGYDSGDFLGRQIYSQKRHQLRLIYSISIVADVPEPTGNYGQGGNFKKQLWQNVSRAELTPIPEKKKLPLLQK